jgi:drug/metabolite transporter (DMT)-like permease
MPVEAVIKPIRAAAFMVAAGFLNTLMLSSIKQISVDIHPIEIGFFRHVFSVLFILPLIFGTNNISVLRTSKPGLHLVRGFLNAAGMLTYFWAVILLPLSTVTAISFTSPIFATLLAFLLLGERVGIRRMSGIFFGLVGMVLILRPGSDSFADFGSILAVVSCLSWAGSMIVIKALTRTDNPLAIIAWPAFLAGVFSLIPALFVWQWPTPIQWGWLILIGGIGTLTQYCYTKAFSLADTTMVLPYDFLKLLWASLFGYFLFTEIPDPFTWIGGAIIFASTAYITFRERAR